MKAGARPSHARRGHLAILVQALILIACSTAPPGASSGGPGPSPSLPASPTTAVEPSASPPAAAEPILQALDYLPITASTFAFTDWVSVKASQGVPDLTSSAPDEERGIFAHNVGLAGAVDTPFSFMAPGAFLGKGLLTQWGFDNLDLDWEASISGSFGMAYLLRLRDGFDLAPVLGRFDERGFATSVVDGVTVRSHELSNEDWVLLGDLAFLNVALMPDGRTLLLAPAQAALEPILTMRGQLMGPEGASVIREAVAALDHPSGAWLSLDLNRLCDPAGHTRPEALATVQQLVTAAGPLHPYSLLAVGYRASLQPAGRIVFGYVNPGDAAADLAGRRMLASEGVSVESARPIKNQFFTVAEAGVEEGTLTLIVGPPMVESLPSGVPPPGVPRLLMQMALRYDMLFAACDLSL